MHRPQFYHVVIELFGSQQCINRWFREHGSCPHCSTSGASYTDLKGIDELLDQAGTLHGDNVSGGEGSPSQSAEGDSDSDLSCLLCILEVLDSICSYFEATILPSPTSSNLLIIQFNVYRLCI